VIGIRSIGTLFKLKNDHGAGGRLHVYICTYIRRLFSLRYCANYHFHTFQIGDYFFAFCDKWSKQIQSMLSSRLGIP
jgi:hypothetical protein